MEINDLLVPEGVVADLKATSKKQALQDLAKRAAEVSGLHERAIFDVLMERERLGTTGVGNGIAIPHGKLASLDRLHGLFARLEQPIDFHLIERQSEKGFEIGFTYTEIVDRYARSHRFQLIQYEFRSLQVSNA